MDREPYGLFGVSTCMNGQDLDYFISAATTKDTPEGMAEYFVPEQNYIPCCQNLLY